MRTLVTAIAVAFAVSLAHGAESSIKDAWDKEDFSPNERTALVERSRREPFAEIAPVVLKVLVDYQPFYGINPKGDTPWNNDGLTARDRKYLMASAVWQHHMTPKDDLGKAKVLLALLQKSSLQPEKAILIGAIQNNQWHPDAETVLLGLVQNKEEDLGIRRSSVSTLLSRCDINTYIPLAVEVVLAHKAGLDRCQAFPFTMNQGNRLFSLSTENRRKILVAGFDIISELPETDLKTGYFVARLLSFRLKQENEFAPNQQERRYQGDHGLTDDFFVETVKNAIGWYRKHNKETQNK
ncbi:MAG: hypothetical protein ACUVWX_00360 [Kiritimatiellia bacterium]